MLHSRQPPFIAVTRFLLERYINIMLCCFMQRISASLPDRSMPDDDLE